MSWDNSLSPAAATAAWHTAARLRDETDLARGPVDDTETRDGPWAGADPQPVGELPEIAVSEALNVREQRVVSLMLARLALHEPTHRGLTVADWLDMARNTDAHLDLVGPWWDQFGDTTVARLAEQQAVPTSVAHDLVDCALYACVAAGTVDVTNHRLDSSVDTVLDLAARASLLWRGHTSPAKREDPR